MKALAVGALLHLYRGIVASGLLDRPRPRRAFEGAYLAYKLLIEAGPVSRLRPYVPEGASVVDVGANIGFFTVRFGRWVGTRGHVYAIEPEARNVVSLRDRVARAGLTDVVECVHAAATERSGTVRLVLNPIHPGDHHLGEAGEPIRAVTLDDLTSADPRRVGLIKIDVQGAELLVLAGAERVIAEHRPAIFMEVDDKSLRRFDTSAEELVRTVARRGYSGHILTRRGISAPQTPEALAALSVSGYIDVLFLSDLSSAGTPAGD